MALAALLLVPAGTLNWPRAWIYLAELTAGSAALTLWLARHDPALLRERASGLFRQGQVPADKLVMAALAVAWCGWMVVMGLDAKRWAWSHMPDGLAYLGAALIGLCFVACWLTFRANAFASAVVRIQDERHQTVATTGLYRVVRHPMYAGAILLLAGVPLLLGSWLGLACVPVLIGLLVLRIAIEERALRDGLAGYADYAARVRWRLVPGVW